MATGDDYTLSGQLKVSDAEAREHQETLLAKRVTDIPNDLQNRFDYDSRSDGQPVYLGYGAKGLDASADGWIIYKHTYDGSGFITLKQTAFDSWSNRNSATYE